MFHMLKVNVHEIWSSTVNVVFQCCYFFCAKKSYRTMYILNIVIFKSKKRNLLAVMDDWYIFSLSTHAVLCAASVTSTV